MTHLDIICSTLASVSGLPESHFRGNIMRGMAASGHDTSKSELLRELTDEEANKHLKALETPAAKRGVLRWLVEAAVAANNMTPQERHKLRTFIRNEQN